MNFLESFNNKTILIPLLQRDYVQGSKDSAVISPFLDSLIEKECDLNYIYGYEEDGCFVPVDGQQRLTTLWLLHLYLFAKKHQLSKYNVRMKFASREYAADFCDHIYKHLENVLFIAREYKSLDEAIKDQNWFIRSWANNTSVSSMLGTLKLIHHKISDENIDEIWNKLVASSVPSITFAFLQMDESNGLDDDIYIKMNGRGRKLSAFENLKSWMDEKVSCLNFSTIWRNAMDNDWTDLFWQNRNLSQKHPEEIDDELLFFFNNLLILYHTQTGELTNKIADIRINDAYLFEELQEYFGIESETDDKKIASGIIDRLQKATHIPLLWYDRLSLMTEEFFLFAFNSLNRMVAISKCFNSTNLFIGENTNEETTLTYQVSMCEGSFNRTFPLFFALLSFKGGKTSLYDWMRTMRNLILNTDISRDSLPELMDTIELFSLSCSDVNIYEILQKDFDLSSLKGFNKDQIKEEILKARHTELYPQMIELENGRFFSGHINILFSLLSTESEREDENTWKSDAETYKSILLSLFDGNEDGGVATSFDDEKHLLRRSLMTVKPYCFGLSKKGYWSFCSGIDEWRKYVNTKDDCKKALYSVIKEVLTPAYRENLPLVDALSKHVESISCDYDKNIAAAGDSSFRHHFIHHPAVWDYMRSKMCSWNKDNGSDGYDIELKTSDGNNSDRMELRTYALYLDYKHNPAYKEDRRKWKTGIWAKWKSCMYLQRELVLRNEKTTIALDVYFYDDKERRTNENCYSFDLFIRTSHPTPENEEEKASFTNEDYQANISLFKNLIPNMMNIFNRKADGRLHSSKLYSRSEIKDVLKTIMQDINKSIED